MFVSTYCDKLIDTRKMITELATKQEPIIREIAEENERLSDKTMHGELMEIQAVIKMYQQRLITLKREMNLLQERSTNLRERAVKLRQNVAKRRDKS
ncbi:hypothetical protein V9T40_000369 [Parthenolecanium corni]|uniref:Uncharacterized protein n=1 Tax=Parthenolecanium corni TaxID=536013 RepID=A0AAN9TBH4_9HEMI